MRRAGLGLLTAVLIGCGAPPAANVPSTGAPPILDGLEETRPYFGRLKGVDSPDRELGDIMLALCGCKCWRIMISRDDGAVRTEVLVHFSPQAGREATDTVVMQGGDDGVILNGTVDQVIRSAEGRVLIGPYAMVFSAGRSERPTDQVQTCMVCHVDDEPLRPLPAAHPEFETGPSDCLSCHPVE